MNLGYLLDLIREHGQVIVFAFAFAHSMIVALLAGYAAQGGLLDTANVLALCWGGSFAGDVVRFWIGRKFGNASWLHSWPRLQRGLDRTARLVDRHSVWLPLVHRYPNGIRTIAGFAYGMSNLSWPRFLGLNFVAAALWASLTVSVGYAFGHISDEMLNDTASNVGAALLVIFLAAAWFLSKRLDRALESG
jgi:membrane protein DedA with SNARE-associated domain